MFNQAKLKYMTVMLKVNDTKCLLCTQDKSHKGALTNYNYYWLPLVVLKICSKTTHVYNIYTVIVKPFLS